MSNTITKYKYTSSQPIHASYKVGDNEVDLIAGKDDVIELSELAEGHPAFKNLIKIGILEKVDAKTDTKK